MGAPNVEQRLAAILAADVAGYSRLMGQDEHATIATLAEFREVFRDKIEANAGRVVDMAGDSILAIFTSATGAVSAATEAQAELANRNEGLPEDRRMLFRVGLNLGDIQEADDGRVYGDGVNVAARLEALASPGGINVSGTVFDSVRSKIKASFNFLGEHEVKNITEPVRAYRVMVDGEAPKIRIGLKTRRAKFSAAIGLFVLVLAIGGVVAWQFDGPRDEADEDPLLAIAKGPSIAVLPFINLSGDTDQDYFSDGLTEEIINGLVRYPDLFVIARGSSFQYKNSSLTIPEIGKALGVRYLVQGSVRRGSDSLRVSAQLVDADSGANLWVESFDREMTTADILSLQDDITEHIISTVGAPTGILYKAELARSSAADPESLDTYQCMLRFFEYESTNFSSETHLAVRRCLTEAVAREPKYADGWAALANVHLVEFWYGWNAIDDDPLTRVLHAAERAVDADTKNARAHAELAHAYFFRQELDLFKVEAERALALAPNDQYILNHMGHRLGIAGEPERSVALTRKAIAYNPAHPTYYYFNFWNYHYWRQEFEQALEWNEKIDFDTIFWKHACLAATYAQLGRMKEAEAALVKLQEVYPGFTTQTLREELYKWSWADWQTELFVEGLVKAGMHDNALVQ